MNAALCASAPPSLRARLLGSVHLAVGGRELAAQVWPRRSARALFLVLLAMPGHRLPRERILDLLWPDASPDRARNALRQALHALRRVLEPEINEGQESAYIESAAQAVGLRSLPGIFVDADAFDAILVTAAARPPALRREPLREALALYGGDLLAEEVAVEWAVTRRERLRLARQHAALELADLALAAGEAREAILPLEALVAADPVLEDGHRALMRAYAASGQRGQALRQYRRCVEALRTELDVAPDEATEALYAALRTEVRRDLPEPTVGPEPVGKELHLTALPKPPTPLVGRVRELETLQELLWSPAVRLVTLTGPGGIGKTRLALEAGAGMEDNFADGVCFRPLDSVRKPGLLAAVIARSLGLREETGRSPYGQVVDALRDRRLLLILDTFEHMLAAASLVAELLAAAPGLKVLATSREPLRLRGEHELPVPSLAVPGRHQIDVTRYEAVELFIQRAKAVRPDFAVTEANAAVLAAICARLDGLPLAIELAAARCRDLTPAALLKQLARPLEVLTGGARDLPERHQTMRAAIAWSYDLLSPDEQALFRRLSVFVGGCTVEAAETVAGARGRGPGAGEPERASVAPAAFGGIAAVVEKNLLRWEEADSGLRLAILETIREYGAECLAASSETESARRAHADYFLALAEQTALGLYGAEQVALLERLETDHDNLLATLGWAIDHHDAERALRLGAALWPFWEMHGHLSTGRTCLDRTLAGAGACQAAQVGALHGAGTLAFRQGDYAAAVERYQVALNHALRLGDQRGAAASLSGLGNVAYVQGAYAQAASHYRQALALARDAGDTWGAARALCNLGNVLQDQGDYERALGLAKEGVALLRTAGDQRTLGKALSNLGSMATESGDFVWAAELCAEALGSFRALGDDQGAAQALTELGKARLHQGDLGRAAAAADESLRLCQAIGDRRGTADALFIRGRVTWTRGNQAEAARCLVDSLALYQQLGERQTIAWCLEVLAEVALGQGRSEGAAHLLGAAEALREAIGAPIPVVERPLHDRCLAAARQTLGEHALATVWAKGRAMPLAEAIAEAVTLAPMSMPNTVIDGTSVRTLTPRELDVLRLIADGRVDREIAAALEVSPRTVAIHATAILTKLGASTRAAAAAQAVRRGLI